MENWKDIKGYEGLYQVSDQGNVRSLHWRGGNSIRNLVPKRHNRGYLKIELAKYGRAKTFLIHRLVAEAFVPKPNTSEDMVVNHIDEDKCNNAASNLEWCDQLQNVRYSVGLHPGRASTRGYKKHTKRQDLRVLQMSEDGGVIREWANSRQVFTTTGMSDWSISECCRGKRKTAYGYIWRYVS
jgi:hypothetical protein